MVVIGPLPLCAEEMGHLIDTEPEHIAVSAAKLLEIWVDRGQCGFKIDGPGELRQFSGPRGQPVTVRIYRYSDDYAAGIVAVDSQTQYARILAVGEYSNQHEIDKIYACGIKRLKEWIATHGTLK